MPYAIVDIETTGGFANKNRIIEVAIVIFDGKEVIEQYETLINPQYAIPAFISGLTGITDEMVAGAPAFEDVADDIGKLLEDKIFVAHNVNFDHGFLKNEFNRIGKGFVVKKLCTVRLTRKVFPGLKSYSLGSLCENFDIPNRARHRAMGDAMATTRLLKKVVENDLNNEIGKALKRNSREAKLPPLLDRGVYLKLPQKPGVYYFLDERGKVLYVGKAKNIRKRIDGHLAADSSLRKSNMLSKVANISYELCGNELIALLHESYAINKHWPEYNRAQNDSSFTYGVYLYEDHNGYNRLSSGRKVKNLELVHMVRSQNEGRQVLIDLYQQFDLCPKLIGLQKTSHACFNHQVGQCDGACVGKIKPEEYNRRLEKALEGLTEFANSFVLYGRGRYEGERGFVLVERGTFQGYGFVDNDQQIISSEEWHHYMQPAQDNKEVHAIIYRYLGHPEYQCINL
jgi:DNA polymerase-3 subunit epsilon